MRICSPPCDPAGRHGKLAGMKNTEREQFLRRPIKSSQNENALMEPFDFDEEGFTFEDLEANLAAELELQLSGLSFLEDEREKIMKRTPWRGPLLND